GAVPVGEMLGRAHVVDVRVGEQHGPDVLGPPADHAYRFVDPREVAGITGVDQRDVPAVAHEVPVDLGATHVEDVVGHLADPFAHGSDSGSRVVGAGL